MKNNAHPDPKDEAGAPGKGAAIISPGTLPARQETVTAEVLARFLAGERMTGMEAVTGSSTTRLAAYVEYLERQYRWSIERNEKATGCRDGRVAWVSVYWIAGDTIAQAMNAGAADWCAMVRATRLKLRADAAKAKRAAERVNARSKGRSNRGQGDMFGGDGASA